MKTWRYIPEHIRSSLFAGVCIQIKQVRFQLQMLMFLHKYAVAKK